MTITMLYILFVLIPHIACIAGALIVIPLVLIGTIWTVYGVNMPSSYSRVEERLFYKKEYNLQAKKYSHIFVCLIVLGAVLRIFTPNDKEMLYIAGGYAATNNAELQKLPDNVLKAANAYLGKITKDIEAPKPDHK